MALSMQHTQVLLFLLMVQLLLLLWRHIRADTPASGLNIHRD